MRKTVSEVFVQIASTVNQEATSPAVGSDEYNLWLQYLNRAQEEWSEAFDWESTRKTYAPGITGLSLASVTLPLNFNKLAGPVRIFNDDKSEPYLYSYVLDENEDMYADTDRYVRITGDSVSGKTMVFNPPTLASGASVYIQMFASPTALASSTDYLSIGDPQFGVDRTIAFILEARSDPRFQILETKARERLLANIENANDAHFNSYASSSFVPTTLSRQKFRVGRD
jgi:hypothetical protein